MTQTRSLLRHVRLRIAAVSAVEDLQRGAVAGGALALAGLAADRAFALGIHPGWAVGAGAVAAVLVPAAGLLVRSPGERALAARADERLGLRERISTSMWARESPDAGPLAALVVADAEASAARVERRHVAAAFRPRLLRRPLLAAGALVAGVAAMLAWPAASAAVETPVQRAARLAEADRIAQVARRVAEQAKRVAEDAADRGDDELLRLARQVEAAGTEMTREPPELSRALAKLNRLADDAKAEAHRRAGLRAPDDGEAATAQDRALESLLEALANAGLESLQRDVAAIEKRIRERGEGKGGTEAEAAADAAALRDLADRVEALKAALEASKEAGAAPLEKSIRTIGNEDLLEKIAERMRDLASKLEERGYQGLESEDEEESLDLSEMSREELEELLKELEALEQMEGLEEMCRGGAGEARGGKRMRIPVPGRGGGGGKGSRTGKGGQPGGDGGENGDPGGSGRRGDGSGGDGSGMGGPGQGSGGKASYGPTDGASRPESVRGRIDPKGRIQVTTFRGLPKPGQLTPEVREAIRAAREEAQAPLESEQIPRRYREGIRAWFDHLEKSK